MKSPTAFLLCFVLMYSSIFAQTGTDSKRTKVYVNETNRTIKANILAKKSSFSADKNRTYFWYANNQILSTQGGFDGKLLDGAYSSFYLNNNLKESGKFKNGLKAGEWRTWYENGQLMERMHWKKGMRNRYYELHNEKGEKIMSSVYKNDQLNGKQIIYQSGKVVSSKKYKNGAEVIVKEKIKKEKVSKEKKVKREKEIQNKEESIKKETEKKIKPVKEKKKSDTKSPKNSGKKKKEGNKVNEQK
jgi:hypothetical protein